MVDKRTEEQKVARAPIVVILGGKEYEIVPLVIRDSREWRRKVVTALANLPGYLSVTSEVPDDFEAALKALLVTMPDTTIDLFFEYAKDLNRDELEGIATEDELAEAFSKMLEVAFPLARSLPSVVGRLSR